MLGLERRGKYLVAPLGSSGPPDADLLAHLGMTGAFHFRGEDGWEPDPYVRATFDLAGPGGETAVLDFRDVRRFGTLAVTPHGDHAGHTTLRQAGPGAALGRVHARRRSTRRCGARPRPSRPRCCPSATSPASATSTPTRPCGAPASTPRPATCPARAATASWAAVREVLAEAITREGTTFRDYRMVNGESGRNADFLDAYGQAGRPCPRCGRPLVKAVVAGRGTTWCRTCQRR